MTRSSLITFYSYKGGAGRTFALANCAALLARVGFRVLAIDWDLEAPGLRHYFGIERPGRGLVDLVDAHRAGESLDWRGLVRPFRVPSGKGELGLLLAGDDTAEDYGARLGALDWRRQYEEEGFGRRLEALRAEWLDAYDLVLVDSRTGLTDIGGICTAQLPDVLVFAFAPNLQALDGTVRAVRKARALRRRLPVDRPAALELPLLTRFDDAVVGNQRERWLARIAAELREHYDQWRHERAEPGKLLELLRIPYRARWSFGEPLAVLEETTTDPDTVSYAFATLASFLARRLESSDDLVLNRDGYVREVERQNRRLFDPGAPADFPYDVFLSYPSEQRALAVAVAEELRRQERERGLAVWLAPERIAPGADWLEELSRGLESSRHCLALSGATLGVYQQAEIAAFLVAAGRSAERRLIPIFLERDSVPEMLGRYHGLTAAGRSAAELATMIRTALGLRSDPPSNVRAIPAPEPEDVLALYRQHVAAAHRQLVPFFVGAGDRLLEEIFVELDLSAEARARSSDEDEDFLRIGTERRASLRELLLLPPTDEAVGVVARWAVEGEPGAGKTTLARNLARALAEEGRTPIYLALARHGTGKLDPFQAAASELGLDPGRATELSSRLRTEARGGSAVLLLDGLDEVDPARIDVLAERIGALAGELPRCPIALFTRPIALERRELGRRFRRAKVEPLDAERRRRLLDKLIGPDDAARVEADILVQPAIEQLCRNPLMLTLAAVVARDALLAESALPANRGRLYRTAIDLLLRRGHCPEPRGVRDRLAARRILRSLSLQLHEKGGEAWSREQLSEAVWELRRSDEVVNFELKETWATNEAFLDDVGHNAGILGPLDGAHAPWRYLHRSLREFLAAEALAEAGEVVWAERMNTWKREVEERDESRRSSSRRSERRASEAPRPDPERWGEVYALLCGLVERPLSVLETLREVSPGLARRALPAVEVLPSAQGLDFLLETPGWTPEEVERTVRAWRTEGGELRAALWRAVRPRPTQELAYLWWLLERGGEPPERGEFFHRAGRQLETAPSIRFILVPAGRFQMGAPESEKGSRDNERPVREVSLAAFELAIYPATVEQYACFDPGYQSPWSEGLPEDEKLHVPVTKVTWWEAWLFCRWIGGGLPTEAQWEYACRAGSTTRFCLGDSEDALEACAWYERNAEHRPHAVGGKTPNSFGLYDMHGNVWEWCRDEYGTYESPTCTGDGERTERGSGTRVIRGGSFARGAALARSACRGGTPATKRAPNFGFRPAKGITSG